MRGGPLGSPAAALAAMHPHHQTEPRSGDGAAAKATDGGSLIIQLPTTSTSANSGEHSAPPMRQSPQRAPKSAPCEPAAVRANISQQHRTASESAYIRAYSACHHHHANPTRDLKQQSHRHRFVSVQQNDSETMYRNNTQPDLEQTTATRLANGSGSSPSTISSSNDEANHNLNSSDSISDDSVAPPPNYHEIPGIVPSYHGRTSGPPPAYDEVVNPNAPPPSYQSLFGQVREARKTSNGLVDLLRQLFLVLIGTIGCTMIIGFLLLIPITMIFVGVFYINECRAENIPAFLVLGGLVWIIKNILNCFNQFKKDSTQVNRPPARRAPVVATTNSTIQQPQLTEVVVTGSALGGRASGPLDANHTQASPEESSTPHQQQQIMTTTTREQNLHHQQNSIRSAQQRHRDRIRQPPMIGLTSYKCESILNYFLIVWFLAGCIVVYRIYEPDYENPLSAGYCNRTVYLYAFWLMTSAFIIMAIVLSCLCCLMASSLMSCSHGR